MLVGNAVTGLPFVLRNGVQAGIGRDDFARLQKFRSLFSERRFLKFCPQRIYHQTCSSFS